MTDYTKSTNFTSKDTLPTGSALKIIKGTEFDTEFNAIATAVATKANLANSELTGTTSVQALTASGTITAAALVVSGDAAVGSVTFEGATADAFETTLNVVDPTADRTILLPNKSGTVALTSDVPNVAITSGTGTYAIAGSTTLTVTLTAHNRVVGEIVYLVFTSGTAVSGEFTVASVTDANNFTVTYGSTLTTSGNVSLSYSSYGLTRIASVLQTIQGTSTDTFVSPSVLQQAKLVRGTAVTCAGQTSIDFTGIPSWAKRITVMFNGVSTSGSSIIQIQLGDSGGIENTNYSGQAWAASTNSGVVTTGLYTSTSNAAGNIWSGVVQFVLLTGTTWVGTGILNITQAGNVGAQTMSVKTLSDTLTQVRITTVNGTDTFDTVPSAGSINILYE